jgi:CheY-like chemotaxis protein
MIMNLVNNALNSMENGGKLNIRTYNRYIESDDSVYGDTPEGEYAVLEVEDSGYGIEKNNISKIFDPFFTTRAKSNISGTGLGLFVVHGIVKDHHGYIDVKSLVGEGSVFSLYFPITRETLRKESSVIFDYSGKEEILVVDDREEQITIANKLLTSLGYKIYGVIGGQEAVQYLRKKQVDLVLLDMIMEEGFDGLDTYKEIIKIRPGQKAIMTSGFSETDRAKEAIRLGAGLYIKKPFTLNQIGLAVREELDRN